MKKVLDFIKTVITNAILIFSVFIMIFTIVSVTTFNRNDKNLFGYKAYIVLSDSMAASNINAGDLVLVKSVDPSTLQEGDIISYISMNPESYGETVTHMIRKLTTDAQGNPGFITYGTSTGVDDATVVTYEYVTGVHTSTLPYVGKFFMFLKTTPGYFVCIFTPFTILICIQGWNTIQLFIKYRKEQMEELEEERRRIEQEKEESKKMMEELKRLQEQLNVATDNVVTEAVQETKTEE